MWLGICGYFFCFHVTQYYYHKTKNIEILTKKLENKHGMRLNINDIVYHSRKGKAIIRYIGELKGTGDKVIYGIELLERIAIGKNSGCDSNDNFVFLCGLCRGLFSTSKRLTLIQKAKIIDYAVENDEIDSNSHSDGDLRHTSDDNGDEKYQHHARADRLYKLETTNNDNGETDTQDVFNHLLSQCMFFSAIFLYFVQRFMFGMVVLCS